jgi:hypothetical protein
MRNLKRAKEQLKANKNVELVKQSLALHYEEVDRNKFYEDMATEYYGIYPTTRVMTDEEKLANDTIELEDGTAEVITREPDIEGNEYVYPEVAIEYVTVDEDGNEVVTEGYVTLEEYKNETRVVTEAIEEVVELDEEGFEVIVQPYVAEVTELVRPFVAKDNYDEEVNGSDLLPKHSYKEAMKYLVDTDFYMTVDKYETLTTERQEEIKAKRAEARVTINDLEAYLTK